MDKVVDRPRHAFIPFSIGKRQCMSQEVTFMMLRVVVFEIYKRYRLRLAPNATVVKNTVVTTKPSSVPIVRIPRQTPSRAVPRTPARVAADTAAPATPAPVKALATVADWGLPTEIPETSAYRHLVIAYGSNFGANKELAERFAERAHFQGYTRDVITLNEVAESPPRSDPWVLVVLTSTYTSNPPPNAVGFKAWLDRARPDDPLWLKCHYLVWGLGNSQWNAFLAFPRYVDKRLGELGATRLADFDYGDVGSPAWERRHAQWNGRVWPTLLELSGARSTEAAAARVASEHAAARALTGADSNTAMSRSLRADAAPRVLLVPTILTNTVGIDTVPARVAACRQLQGSGSEKNTRHVEVVLPSDVQYRAGDHLGVCPRNDEERVERLAQHLGAALDSLFMVPKPMNVRSVPKGVVLQVRNVLTHLVDMGGRPTVPLVELLVEKATDAAEQARLTEVRDILDQPDGPDSPLRAAIDAGGYDVVRLLDDFPSCSLNIFEFLRVAQPLRPRYYSTSSSPRVHGDCCAHITVGLEVRQVPGMPGREFRGVSGHYLHTVREGDRLNVFVDRAEGFHLQDDASKPMIFVAAGTGFAPMRAFLWERFAMKQAGLKLGEAALFNGIRSRRIDYIYREEIERLAADGVLDHVHVATSRERAGRREYVQDALRTQGALVWRLLAGGGYVYVCGSQPMRTAVRKAFLDLIAEHGSLHPEHAEAYLDALEHGARYRPDTWG